ncbi:MAG: hypothetical protein JWM28_3044, partial [Chitinophagaceae bacterium]|nr:hypothetical protein [Chitinophagaceae bacterium]
LTGGNSNIIIMNISFQPQKTHLVPVLFWMTIIFQFSVFKDMWGIAGLSRIANIGLLILLSILCITSLLSNKFDKRVWAFYLIPGFLVFFGMMVNIGYNVIVDTALASYFGLVLPWATFLMVPFLIKAGLINAKSLWKQFYFFMVTALLLALTEYFLVLFANYPLRLLTIPNGVFLTGRFALFHMLEDATPHERFYACFGEPGTLAMYLLPAIAYAFFYKRYFGMILFLVALYFTKSLGGMIGLVMLIVTLPFFYFSKKQLVKSFTVVAVLATLAIVFVGQNLKGQYDDRDDSKATREDNLRGAITNLSTAIVSYPFGLPLAESTEKSERNSLYFGSNFTLGYAFITGGIAAFLGYTFFLLVSLGVSIISISGKNLTNEQKTVFLSIIVLFPFIFQRMTVWDSSMFAFLFSPMIIQFLSKPVATASLQEV